MKGKISLAFLILLAIAALGFYVFAQVQPGKPQEEAQKRLEILLPQSQFQKLLEEKQKTVRATLLIDQQYETVAARIHELENRVSELERRITLLENPTPKLIPTK
jgi:polyhydroxyalkanoate synthesis regulator phasin